MAHHILGHNVDIFSHMKHPLHLIHPRHQSLQFGIPDPLNLLPSIWAVLDCFTRMFPLFLLRDHQGAVAITFGALVINPYIIDL